jgi:predicted nucleic acid-binding protein
MATILVDASIVIAAIADEPARDQILEATDGQRVIAVNSMEFEVGNALPSLMKRGRLDLAGALRGLTLFRDMKIDLVAVSLEGALELAARYNVYAYDAYVLEAARTSGAVLYALDRRMASVAAAEGLPCLEAPG